ncbi:MAG: response regulator transcription factor [Elusimicrobia bacterium]|nr:response regulator transcription factor [Elusimicrobiota bacterium]
MPGEKILLIEDERSLAKVLRYNLEKEGYKVSVAGDGELGLSSFERDKPDLVILDLMLPKINGFELCRRFHDSGPTPILLLTARKAEADRVKGLELGADDYVTKPFSPRELLARIKAILRRASAPASESRLSGGEVRLDLERYEASASGKPVSLTSREFELLKLLLEAKGRALTRQEILEKVWGYGQEMRVETSTVDQHVRRLRLKLGAEASRIVTVKNVGYRFKED